MHDAPRTVLVVDDDAHLLRLVKFRLERDGYDVTTAADGERALERIRERPPDLCVLDIMMPRRSGLDVLRELRADARLRAVKVILLTARAQDHDIAAGLGLGADDYVTKPFSPRELSVRVGAQLTEE